ncbi:MAG: hypothetical protein Q4F40_09580 [Akkermansia sp.]|nr:hypothetical protein [Akkermansia sp.]
MKLTDTDLDVSDREWVESVLQADEELLLLCKPQVRLWRWEYTPITLFSILWLGGVATISIFALCKSIDQLSEEPGILLLLLFFVPFWVLGIGMLSTPWRMRALDRRTVYLLTNRRAVVLRPSDFRFLPTQKDYPLEHGMIKEVQEKGDGSGSLVFGYEVQQTKGGENYLPVGFLHVPQLQRVKDILLSALQEFAEPLQEPEAAPPEPKAEAPSLILLVVASIIIAIGLKEMTKSVTTLLERAGNPAEWLFELVAPSMLIGFGSVLLIAWFRDYRKYTRQYQQHSDSKGAAE